MGGGLAARRARVLPAARQSAVPFTPGHRPAAARRGRRTRAALLAGARARSRGNSALSSLHVLFPRRARPRHCCESRRPDAAARLPVSLAQRQATARSTTSSAGFTAEKRKKLRRERRRVAEVGIECRTLTGADLDEATHRRDLHGLHATTFCAPRPRALPESGLLRRACARVMPGNLVVELAFHRRRTRRLRDPAARRGHAVRPLLGCERRPPQPAFRALLLPRHRVLHSREARRASSPARRASTSSCVASCRHRCGPCTRSPTRALPSAIGDWLARERGGPRANGSREAATHLPFRRADIPARLEADVRYRLAPED